MTKQKEKKYEWFQRKITQYLDSATAVTQQSTSMKIREYNILLGHFFHYGELSESYQHSEKTRTLEE